MSTLQSGTYSMHLVCGNCGHSATYQIPKGNPYGTAKCNNCGCSGMNKGLGYRL